MIQSSGSIRYFQFKNLLKHNINHGIFMRNGGVSQSHYSSLNVGGSVGDGYENVRENIRRSMDALNRKPSSISDVFQVHGNHVVIAKSPRLPETPLVKADGIITKDEYVTLFMRFADCAPLMVFDPRLNIIAIGHAGWKGTSLGIATKLINTMADAYGSKPGELVAGIGPSIGPGKYEIGQDVVDEIETKFGYLSRDVLIKDGIGIKLDLWEANKIQFEQAGVQDIEVAGICTASNTDDWFSHRGDGGLTGRFGAAIALH